MNLLQLITGFGLASAAGGRASLVALLLGLFHYTDYFELSPSYVWLASIPVMCALGVVAVAEIWIDSHPDLKEFAHYPTYLSSFIVGFIALSASTGDVDQNLLLLAGSGILGGLTSSASRYARNQITTFIDHISGGIDASLHDGAVNSTRSWGENAATVGIGISAILMPILGLICIMAIAGFFLWKKNNSTEPST